MFAWNGSDLFSGEKVRMGRLSETPVGGYRMQVGGIPGQPIAQILQVLVAGECDSKENRVLGAFLGELKTNPFLPHTLLFATLE